MMSAEPRTSSDRDTPPGRAVASVVVTRDDAIAVYPMFEAIRLTTEGAFLAGSLFLEVGEITTLELSWDQGTRVRVQARVISLSRGEEPGMAVVFLELDERERKLIEERATTEARP
jgi:hypothetical protein